MTPWVWQKTAVDDLSTVALHGAESYHSSLPKLNFLWLHRACVLVSAQSAPGVAIPIHETPSGPPTTAFRFVSKPPVTSSARRNGPHSSPEETLEVQEARCKITDDIGGHESYEGPAFARGDDFGVPEEFQKFRERTEKVLGHPGTVLEVIQARPSKLKEQVAAAVCSVHDNTDIAPVPGENSSRQIRDHLTHDMVMG